MLIERGEHSPSELIDAPGVGGMWWGGSLPEPKYTTAQHVGVQITYCFLDEDPAEVGLNLRPILEERWRGKSIEPLFAAPFHVLVPHQWDRFVP